MHLHRIELGLHPPLDPRDETDRAHILTSTGFPDFRERELGLICSGVDITDARSSKNYCPCDEPPLKKASLKKAPLALACGPPATAPSPAAHRRRSLPSAQESTKAVATYLNPDAEVAWQKTMEELPAIVLRWAEGKLGDKDAELGPDTEALPSPCRADFPVLSLSNQAIEEHAAQTEVIQEVGAFESARHSADNYSKPGHRRMERHYSAYKLTLSRSSLLAMVPNLMMGTIAASDAWTPFLTRPFLIPPDPPPPYGRANCSYIPAHTQRIPYSSGLEVV
ncbi:hypothetical protein B0H14DRAFT_2599824 [Mycena olivaceomarginata]|nr:hypothetical protein B0H14DRAFT_2599824 [Mycena olivaceomarginata]